MIQEGSIYVSTYKEPVYYLVIGALKEQKHLDSYNIMTSLGIKELDLFCKIVVVKLNNTNNYKEAIQSGEIETISCSGLLDNPNVSYAGKIDFSDYEIDLIKRKMLSKQKIIDINSISEYAFNQIDNYLKKMTDCFLQFDINTLMYDKSNNKKYVFVGIATLDIGVYVYDFQYDTIVNFTYEYFSTHMKPTGEKMYVSANYSGLSPKEFKEYLHGKRGRHLL